MTVGKLQEMVPTMIIFTYSSSDIEKMQKVIVSTVATLAGTSEFHEILAKPEGMEVMMYASRLLGEAGKKFKI